MAEVTEQIIREAPEIEALKVGLIKSAKTLSEQPLAIPAYEAAGLSDLQKQAMQLGASGIGAYAPFLQAGQGAVEAGIGSLGTAQQVMGAGIASIPGATMGYNPQAAYDFMNPYQQAVTQQALGEMRRQADIARQGQAAQAIRAGAFGGTREGVQRAEFERGVQDVMSQRIMQDYAQNYAQAQQAAQQAFEAQQQRSLSGAGLYGQLGQGIGSLGQALGQMGMQQAQLGEAATRLGLQDVSTLMSLGQTQQQAEQSRLEAARATALQRAMTPYQQLSFLSDIYKGAPGTQMAITAGTAPSTSPLLQAAGLGVAGLSAAAGAQRAGLFG